MDFFVISYRHKRGEQKDSEKKKSKVKKQSIEIIKMNKSSHRNIKRNF